MPNSHFTKQYNKIVIAGDTLIDLSADTVAAGLMLAKDGSNNNVTAHDKNGAIIQGSIQTKTDADVTIATTGTDAGKATVPAGYYATQVQKAMTTAVLQLAEYPQTVYPTITKETSAGENQGKIKSSVPSEILYVNAFVRTPGFISESPDPGSVSISGTEYVTAESIESNLTAANVKAGVTIFKTTGTFTADGTATAGEILIGETAYVNGSKVTGTMPKYDDDTTDHVTITSTSDVTIPAGYYDGSVKAGIDSASKDELVASNILTGHTILGVEGTLEPSSAVTHGPVTVTAKFNASGTPQTVLPSSISKQFIDSVTVNAISFSETQTGTTSGYTFTISNTF